MTRTRQEKIQLAEQAKQILNNPAWHSITTKMMDDLQQSWADCLDPVVREDLWHRQNALHDLIGDIEVTIMNGEIALSITPEEG